MPDYCRCQDHSCPKRNSCCRYLMIPGDRQTVFVGSPRDGKECDSFWDVKYGAPFKLKQTDFRNGGQ
jgi:hypothetical protein